ncbi:acyl carrier protein [Streptomyces sp. NPDC057245]|uniref:acyl carrier protein n=1 Tax=Streptomyces TaxID=1883 RepID=UPI001C1DD5E7|nr:acyl carrier protein [Streptomyces sp. A108]MBU6531248.1 acyl carrier protein [Streptomyces sp. A108]
MALSEWEILDGLAEILNEETGVPTASVELGTRFAGDLGADAATMRLIAAHIEQKFRVPRPDAAAFVRVGDAVAHIQAAQG